jgi:hypothetical protein
MKKTVTKRYRLNFYSFDDKIVVQTDSNNYIMLLAVYDAQGQYYSRAVLLFKNSYTDGKWEDRSDLLKINP